MKEWKNPEIRELGVESTEKGPDNIRKSFMVIRVSQ